MLRAFRRVALSFLLGISATVATAEVQTLVPTGVLQTLTTSNHGETRTYAVYVPAALRNVTSRPAVFMLHGAGGNAAGMASLVGIQAAADAHGFVAVLPETTAGRAWDNGRVRPDDVDNDDVGYILKVVSEVTQYQRVNPARIFIAGVSSGGEMSMRMDCEAATKFQGVGAVSSLLPTQLQGCKPARSLPFVLIYGSADDTFPYNGIPNKVLGYTDTRSHWTTANACQQTTGPAALPDRFADGTTVTLETKSRCSRSDVVLNFYLIQGGGHVWPGMTRGVTRPGQLNSQEIDATDTVMEFFSRYGL